MIYIHNCRAYIYIETDYAKVGLTKVSFTCNNTKFSSSNSLLKVPFYLAMPKHTPIKNERVIKVDTKIPPCLEMES
ncbi:hypothetical protein HanIR_Chr08g0373381 [Helianthus annuus]|nr:hypothetical protein HanIR_Chr08g0373381 [Helianthus annuus]